VRHTVLVVALALGVALAVFAAEPAAACDGKDNDFAPCPKDMATPMSAKPSLYKRLGGREGIAQVVDQFVANMTTDDRVSARFKNMQPAAKFKLASNLADQICEATGGPCSYVGASMKDVHKGMNITEAEWNATVENLTKALDKFNVGAAEKNELIAALAPMKGDIVGK
jgi:hemoglobin